MPKNPWRIPTITLGICILIATPVALRLKFYGPLPVIPILEQRPSPSPTLNIEQVQEFARISRIWKRKEFAKRLNKQGHNVFTSGTDHDVITIMNSALTDYIVYEFTHSDAWMSPYRELGFTKLVFTNGDKVWPVDIE